MHILDTDTLTHLHLGHPRVAEHIQRAADSEICTTLITKIEILRGRFASVLKAGSGTELIRAQTWLLRAEELLAQIAVVPFTQAAANQFDVLRSTKKLNKIGNADLLIASTALSIRATLVTRNVRHFEPIPGLLIVNWVD